MKKIGHDHENDKPDAPEVADINETEATNNFNQMRSSSIKTNTKAISMTQCHHIYIYIYL